VGGALGTPTSLVSDAHASGLQVHPYTFRNENNLLPPALREPPATTTALSDYGDAFAEYRPYLRTGIDGLFSDNADTAVTARADFLRKPGA
jgi:glycerophosphoryl diester phosphodiesterase